jgi:hypothetical protein
MSSTSLTQVLFPILPVSLETFALVVCGRLSLLPPLPTMIVALICGELIFIELQVAAWIRRIIIK